MVNQRCVLLTNKTAEKDCLMTVKKVGTGEVKFLKRKHDLVVLDAVEESSTKKMKSGSDDGEDGGEEAAATTAGSTKSASTIPNKITLTNKENKGEKAQLISKQVVLLENRLQKETTPSRSVKHRTKLTPKYPARESQPTAPAGGRPKQKVQPTGEGSTKKRDKVKSGPCKLSNRRKPIPQLKKIPRLDPKTESGVAETPIITEVSSASLSGKHFDVITSWSSVESRPPPAPENAIGKYRVEPPPSAFKNKQQRFIQFFRSPISTACSIANQAPRTACSTAIQAPRTACSTAIQTPRTACSTTIQASNTTFPLAIQSPVTFGSSASTASAIQSSSILDTSASAPHAAPSQSHSVLDEEDTVECQICETKVPPKFLSRHYCAADKRLQTEEKNSVTEEELPETGSESTFLSAVKVECDAEFQEVEVDPLLLAVKEEPDDDEDVGGEYDEEVPELPVHFLVPTEDKEETQADHLNSSLSPICRICKCSVPGFDVLVHFNVHHRHVPNLDQYSCPFCPRTFSSSVYVEKHIEGTHLRSKEKCNVCGVRFANLKAHQEKYHTMKNMWTCKLCGKVVKYLNTHNCPLNDTPEKNKMINCPSCGNIVKEKYLRIHTKSHCVGSKSSSFSNFRTEGKRRSAEEVSVEKNNKDVVLKPRDETLNNSVELKQTETAVRGVILNPR